MTMPIIWHPQGFVELRYNPLLMAEILHEVEPVVEEARAAAPKKTGAGAASIRAEITYEETAPSVRIGWDVEHYYMKFHEKGTKYLPARPFLAPAVDRYLK